MIKQGYPWIYREWLNELPKAAAGSRALLKDQDGTMLAYGMYDPVSPLAMRVCAVEQEMLDDDLVLARLAAALNLRQRLFDTATTGYRLINGEGDGLPGLVCDMYDTCAVIKLDGDAPAGFWNLEGFAQWLTKNTGASSVFLKFRSGADTRGQFVCNELKSPEVVFLEQGIKFQADIVQGQKTGFFFDQRDNRKRIGDLSKGRRVLNLFGYTGGFSIYAGMNGASHVTTVDLAKPAIEYSVRNWEINGLPPTKHAGIAEDVFSFLEEARKQKQTWDLIIVDPPSFAPAEKHVEKAVESYTSLFASALQLVEPGGIIAPSSCSSHISSVQFKEICQAAFSKARRRGTILGIYGQPEDHPFPLACPELQYLKFVTLRVA